MKKFYLDILIIVWFIVATACIRKEPWSSAQLMLPEDLAAVIEDSAATPPLIICIGPAGLIPGSVEAGETKEPENLDKLKQLLAGEDKDRDIVLYCGCCPFKDCPNIRPAFSLANSMGFRNHKLLDLSQNLKVNWIDPGYPVSD